MLRTRNYRNRKRCSCKQRGECPRGDDPRAFVVFERKQLALVAGHQIVRPARFGQGQQKIVGRIGGLGATPRWSRPVSSFRSLCRVLLAPEQESWNPRKMAVNS